MYPYSQSTTRGEQGLASDFNYVRNSVKATVDAYDGTVTFYVFDPKDPIIQAWRKAFPDLFTDASKMSTELRAHLRYPEDLFKAQADQFGRYHVTEPRRSTTAARSGWSRPTPVGPGRRTDFGALTDVGSSDTAATRSRRRPRPTGQRIDPYYLYLKLPEGRLGALHRHHAVRAGVVEQPRDAARVVPHRQFRPRPLRRAPRLHHAAGRDREGPGPGQQRHQPDRARSRQSVTLLNTQGSRVDPGEPAADPRRQLVADLRAALLRPGPPERELPAVPVRGRLQPGPRRGLRADRQRRPRPAVQRRPCRPPCNLANPGNSHGSGNTSTTTTTTTPGSSTTTPVPPPPRPPRLPDRCATSSTRPSAEFSEADAALAGRAISAPTRRSRSRAADLVAQAQQLALSQ